MGDEGLRAAGGRVLRDGVLPDQACVQTGGGAEHPEEHHKGGDGDACRRSTGGGPQKGIKPPHEEENTKRKRIEASETAEWLKIDAERAVASSKGVDTEGLKKEMKELSVTIRELKKAEPKDSVTLQTCINRMNAIRSFFAASNSRKRVLTDTDSHKKSKPEIPSHPVQVPCSVPLYRRSSFTQMGDEVEKRSKCRHVLSDKILDTMLAGVEAPYSNPDAFKTSDLKCEICLWNVTSYFLTNGWEQHAKETLLPLISDETQNGYLALLKGIVLESTGSPSELFTKHYTAAVTMNGHIGKTYFGVCNMEEHSLPLSIFKDFRIISKEANTIQHRDMKRLLKHVMFNKRGMDAYPSSCPTKEIKAANHVCVRHLISPSVVALLSQHYNDLITTGAVTFGDRRTARYFAYNDPLARIVMAQLTPYIKNLVGTDVKPSYSYMISYRDASELVPHQDREQAEIVVSIQLSMTPECDVWPLCIGNIPQPPKRGDAPRPAPHDTSSHVMYNGDAVIFKGRVMIHWRDVIPPGTETTVLLVHYVHSDFKGSLKTGFND